ncbi:MAG: hypothetical protein ACREOM_08800 [Candidatus Dormibacteraceae bacterium]
MSPSSISEDGRWWWDGTRWHSRLVEGELDLLWFTTTPDWFGRVALTGLIGLIPIVGTINLLGWTLVATDMVRRRWRELPPAGFQYLERGVAPFIVLFTYGLAFLLLVGALAGTALAIVVSNPHQAAAAVFLGFLAFVLLVAWWLLMLYLTAAVIIGSDQLGPTRALDPTRLFALAQSNREVTLRVAVIYGLASVALAVVALSIGLIIPGSSLILSIALPAVFAMLVPHLARFRVDADPAPKQAVTS